MRRGEIYLLERPPGDPRPRRPMVVVSRDGLINTGHSTVICAPIYSSHHGIQTEVRLDERHGLRQESSAHCDDLRSIEKWRLTNFLGSLDATTLAALDRALAVALGIEHLLEDD